MLMLFYIKSLNIEKLKLFYSSLGLKILDLNATKSFSGVNNFFIVLDKDTCSPSRNLYCIKNNNITKFNTHTIDTNESDIILDLYNKIKNFNSIDQYKKIIPVIRCNDIEHTSSNYSYLGPWIKEKHGAGPEHYCLSEQGIIAEIYPVRKTKPIENIELVFDGYDASFINTLGRTIEDPDGENVVIIGSVDSVASV